MNLLREAFGPAEACHKLTEAIKTGFPRFKLYCDGTAVLPHFAIRLMIEPKRDAQEWRWSAKIVSAVNEAWEQSSYDWEFDVDEVVTLLPMRRGRKGGKWKTYARLEMERLGRKAMFDLHNRGQSRPHLSSALAREDVPVPKDNKDLDEVIRAFLRGD
jgi:hypothetical protein